MAVTSTKVATKGAEDTAGSAPNFLSTMGNMDPVMVPQITTPKMVNPMVKAISNQCTP